MISVGQSSVHTRWQSPLVAKLASHPNGNVTIHRAFSTHCKFHQECSVFRFRSSRPILDVVKHLTREQVESRKEQAVRFTESVLGDPDRADEIANESAYDYAERKGIEIVSNPSEKRRNNMSRSTKSKAELEQENEDLKQENDELRDQIDAVADIISPSDEDEDDEDVDDEDEADDLD